jgi:carbon monoxide dehydrogenase subunit G
VRASYDTVVDRSIESVWASLTDVDSVLAALPGAALAREGDGVSGSLKCKFGSTQVTYRITARADVGQPEFRTALLAVTGKEARGGGTMTASITVNLRGGAPANGTRIEVAGDIEATGRGEKADEAGWQRVIESLVNALLPPAAPEPAPAAAIPPRPPLTVAAQPAERRAGAGAGADAQRWAGLALIVVVVLVLLRRLRTHK